MNIILLVASKITARDLKKSTILLAIGLPTAIAISVGLYLFFSKVTLDQDISTLKLHFWFP